MTVVVLGIDALDPELVDPDVHPHLTLQAFEAIETISSSSGEPSTHELWPTIITGLPPEEHGLQLDDGVAWEHPVLSVGSTVGRYLLPNRLRARLGAWILNNTAQDQFRTPSSYYDRRGIETVFDDRIAKPIGIPNYVTTVETEDREHELRRTMGDLFERDLEARGGHISSEPERFYDLCMEMTMIRIARVRRALRSRRYELVFGYTSGLDLVGHVAFDRPKMQIAAYEEIDQFVGELAGDIGGDDVLILVSDHGLQDGIHTHEAMVSSTDPDIVSRVDSVTAVRDGIEYALESSDHEPTGRRFGRECGGQLERVKEQLQDLGYV